MKTAHLDCFSGISGDMCLGAIVDAGVPLPELRRMLTRLPVAGYSLSSRKVLRAGLSATKVDVTLDSSARRKMQEGTAWRKAEDTIRRSTLPETVKATGLRIFRALFEAEAAVHGRSIATVHLHEAGAVDCFVDIFGTVIGLELLGIKSLSASALNVGSGMIATDHGVMPVPAPATAALLRGIPVHADGPAKELTTPTGAAIVSCLAKRFVPLPPLTIERTAMGAGTADFDGWPNVLRLIVGRSSPAAAADTACVIEANIDDMSPQLYDHVFERLFRHGALDVWLTPILMKKLRPAHTLSVLCPPAERQRIAEMLFRETTTIGVRSYETQRERLEREFRKVVTRYGAVLVKVSSLGGERITVTPEYEDCRRLAKREGIPLREMIEEAKRAGREGLPESRRRQIRKKKQAGA